VHERGREGAPLPEVAKHGSVIFREFETGVAFLRDVQRAGAAPRASGSWTTCSSSSARRSSRANRACPAEEPAREVLRHAREALRVDRMVACTLLFEGTRAEVAAQERAVLPDRRAHGGLKGGAENGRRGYALTFAIAYIRDFMMDHHVLAESFETAVPWSQCVSLIQNVKQRLWQEHAKRGLPGRPFVSARVTQLYETGVCVYFYFAFYARGVAHASEVYAEVERAAREEILRSGGSLSHHHGVGKLRQRFLPAVLSPTALDWREGLKRAVDPDNLFGCAN
jgi:alkyldihydroxyacetonephosphate synthase